jgi:hypothetical protein
MVHPRLSHNEHPVDGVMMGAGALQSVPAILFRYGRQCAFETPTICFCFFKQDFIFLKMDAGI